MGHVESRVGIASYSFQYLFVNKMMDVYGYLESLAYRYHVPNADIWNGFIKDMDVDDFKKIRRALDDRGLVLANLCCDWAHLWDNDPDYIKELDRMAEHMLTAADILGARTIRFDLGVREEEISETQFDYTCEKFAKYAKRAENAGQIIGPENHWGASRRLSVQKRLYKEINSKAYGMLLHLGNWILEDGETPDGNDQAAIEMAFHTHLPYEYALRADEILPPLASSGYKGVWSIEHHRKIREYQGVQAHVGLILYTLAKIEEAK